MGSGAEICRGPDGHDIDILILNVYDIKCRYIIHILSIIHEYILQIKSSEHVCDFLELPARNQDVQEKLHAEIMQKMAPGTPMDARRVLSDITSRPRIGRA